jgi:NAD(P)H-flavin reductase
MLGEQSSWMPTQYKVLSRREEIPGCTTLCVSQEEKAGSFQPGQFYMIYVFGHGEVPISVSGDSNDSSRLTFTIMNVGSVTRALCGVKVGSFIGLRGPFGSSWPLEAAAGKDVVFVAGGLGIAPLRPAIYDVLRRRSSFRRVTLLYGARSPAAITFHQEVQQWQREQSIEVAITVDHAGREWKGKVGIVTDLLRDSTFDPARTIAMVCGPEVMMRFTAYSLLDHGVLADQLYVSMERNMKCAVGMCGRCQYGPFFVCKDGPVFSFNRVQHLFRIREV